MLADVRKMLEDRETTSETDSRVLEAADLIAAVRYLVSLRKGRARWSGGLTTWAAAACVRWGNCSRTNAAWACAHADVWSKSA